MARLANMMMSTLLVLLCLSTARITTCAGEFASPLFAESRWMVDKFGKRVKLACVNWPSHMQTVVAEGLHRQPVDSIIFNIKSMGFNCVRFTWPIDLPTNNTLASMTVQKSFQSLGLNGALLGIKANNPWILQLTLIDAFKGMLGRFEENEMMVVLDNHVSLASWCCGEVDGNGFFGDKYFDPKLWIQGLNTMATIASKFQCVVGMSLRNELRGPKSNVDLWYKYMEEGAATVHSANPNVLVMVSGLKYDTDLSFIRDVRPFNVPGLAKKLVFEMHWYSFSDLRAWRMDNSNDVCGSVGARVMNTTGFLVEMKYPLFVSEFGANERGARLEDNKYLNCFMAYAVDQDWDTGIWSLHGTYYLRKGVVDMDEDYGLLDYQWAAPRNRSFLNRVSVLQIPFRGPPAASTQLHNYKIVFHPQTGLCISNIITDHDHQIIKGGALRLGPCQSAQAWIYNANDKALRVMQMPNLFLQAVQPNKPATLLFLDPAAAAGSTWEPISASKLHLSSKLKNNQQLCLDVDGNSGFIVTNFCKCITKDNTCEPFSQWFKIVDTTRPVLM